MWEMAINCIDKGDITNDEFCDDTWCNCQGEL